MSTEVSKDPNKLSCKELEEFSQKNSDTEDAFMANYLSTACKAEAKLSYPVNSIDDFIRMLGDQEIGISKKGLRAADIKGEIPSFYFPIKNREDFLEKAKELGKVNHVVCQMRKRTISN